MPEKLLSLQNVGIYRENRWLVHDINLDLYRGEILTLIGPNGSGKTTTIKLALGILSATKGTIWRKEGLKIGYVPQKLTIDKSFPMSVMRLMQLTEPHNRQNILTTLEAAGTLHVKNTQLSALSGGELQRVLLARAVIKRPDILVLDEPLQGVDYTGERQLYEWITRLRGELNCAVLLISHDLHIVMAATDRVICLNGHICCSGTPEVVQTSESYADLLREQPLALYRHHHKKEYCEHKACLHGPSQSDLNKPKNEKLR